MGKPIPFSSIDKFLAALPQPITGCVVDTNFLVAVSEELHSFYDDAEFIFEKLAEYRIPIFTTVTTRSEYIDIRRRLIITETLMDMLAPGSKWKISHEVQKVLRAQRTWIDQQAKQDSLPILPDSRIKICKESFMPKSHSGKIGWVEICEEYLTGKLIESWKILVENFHLNYLDMKDNSSYEIVTKELNWDRMYQICEKTCLSSSDSMILNVLKSSRIPFIVSADFDMAYALLADNDTDKSVLIPDKLYKAKIKKLGF